MSDSTYSPFGTTRILPDDFDDLSTTSTAASSDHHGSQGSHENGHRPTKQLSSYSFTDSPLAAKHRAGSLPSPSPLIVEPTRTDRAVSLPNPSLTTPVPGHKVQRKLSRKLPPRLTESLENLSLSLVHAHQRPVAIDPYILEVEVLADEEPESPVTPSPAPRRRKSIKQLIARRSSTSTANSISDPSPTPPMPSFNRHPSQSSSRGTSGPSSHILTPSSSRHFRHSVESAPNTCSSGSASTCGTWSAIDEHDSDSAHKKESRAERKARRKHEAETFNVDHPPTMRELYDASLLDVIDEAGQRVKFGDLVRRRRTIVIFIRHWFCPLCAQYMNSIVSQVSPDTLDQADVDLVIIGNGSRKMVSAYRTKALRCPFPIYTDPSLQLYRALGLTRQTGDAGPDIDAGDYLVQTPMEATLATIKRATQMPLRNPGHFTQLGGEFVFDGTLNVMYTHRMSTTRAHSPIRDVCAAAGVRLEWVHFEPGLPPPPVHRRSIIEEVDEDVEPDWRASRDDEIERMKRAKEQRRWGGRGGYQQDQIRVVGEDDDLEDFEDDFDNLHFVR